MFYGLGYSCVFVGPRDMSIYMLLRHELRGHEVVLTRRGGIFSPPSLPALTCALRVMIPISTDERGAALERHTLETCTGAD